MASLTTGKGLKSCTAVFEWKSSKNEHLQFPQGAIILNVTEDESGWWRGQYSGKYGLFPGNYVRRNYYLKERYTALHEFRASPDDTGMEELSLRVGDQIVVTDKDAGTANTWYYGYLADNPEFKGWFPRVCVNADPRFTAGHAKSKELPPVSPRNAGTAPVIPPTKGESISAEKTTTTTTSSGTGSKCRRRRQKKLKEKRHQAQLFDNVTNSVPKPEYVAH